LIGKRSFRILITITFVAGLLIILESQPAFARSAFRDGRENLVDGGQLFEEVEQNGGIKPDLEYDLAQFRLPPRAITRTSRDSLAPIPIMPLGDSITKGTGTCSEPDTYLNCIGYREDLWNALVDNGYSIDFVGSQGAAFQYQYSYDNDHEGHGGKTADWIRDRVYGPSDYFLLDNPMDIVLLHIGTNDINGLPLLGDSNDIVTEVSQILDKIDNYETSEGHEVWVILAKIINRSDPLSDKGQLTTDFNLGLQPMAESRIAGGDNLLVVDMESALTYPDDLGDALHPNETGYSKMANEWFSALEQVIFNLMFNEKVVLPLLIR
jgi:lysophospholipase L1-like esterase